MRAVVPLACSRFEMSQGVPPPGQDPGDGEPPFHRSECDRARSADGDFNRNRVGDAVVGEYEAVLRVPGGHGSASQSASHPAIAAASRRQSSA